MRTFYISVFIFLASLAAVAENFRCEVRIAPGKHGIHRSWYDVMGRSYTADSLCDAYEQCACQVTELGWRLDQDAIFNLRVQEGHDSLHEFKV